MRDTEPIKYKGLVKEEHPQIIQVSIPRSFTVFMDEEVHEGIGKIEFSERRNQRGLELKVFEDSEKVESLKGPNTYGNLTLQEGYCLKVDSQSSFQVKLYDAEEGHMRENYNSVGCLRVFETK